MNTNIIGDITPFPGSNGMDIIQQQNDTCAIKSQQIVLHAFGYDIPEEFLTEEAINKGYYIPGVGSDPMQVGRLLQDHGVNTHTKMNATIYDLVAELAQGHKVIVGVDADELWRPSFFNDLFGEQANHALIVTGIDTTNPDDIRVLLTDPGTGDVARSYPMEQFLDAWHDSSCQMVATNQAPLVAYNDIVINPELQFFDYNTGHIPFIANMPYDFYINSIVPQMDSYYENQFPLLHSGLDYNDMYNHMWEVYNSFDDAIDLSLISHGYNDPTVDDLHSFFDDGYHFAYNQDTYQVELLANDYPNFEFDDYSDLFNTLFF